MAGERSERSKAATRQEIRSLVARLESEDAATRMNARSSLTEVGPAAVGALTTCLHDPRQHVRWEAAKTLEAIAAPSAAPALVYSLDDDDQDVRWVAGEALIALRDAGLPALLTGLIRHSHSLNFRRAAHHVLHDLTKSHPNELFAKVLEALDSAEPAVAAPPAAWTALRSLTIDPHNG